MTKEEEYQKLIKKVNEITKEKGKLDLSSDEDLSIAIMNLISIEEHLFFSGERTGKGEYFDLLYEVREMRKELLKKIIKDYEGEGWCISKHLLASSMRLMEVGTKELTKGDKKEARNLFDKSYKLYSLFWGINLNLVNLEEAKETSKKDGEIDCLETEDDGEGQDNTNKSKMKATIWDKLSKIIQKAINCCKE